MSQSVSKLTLGFIGLVVFAVIGLRVYQMTHPALVETVITPQPVDDDIVQPQSSISLTGTPTQTTLTNFHDEWWLGFQQQDNYYIQNVDNQLQPKAEPIVLVQQLNQVQQIIHSPWLLTNGTDWYVVVERLVADKRYYQIFWFDADFHVRQQFTLSALSSTTKVTTAVTLAESALVIAEDDGEGIVVANFSHLPDPRPVQQRFSDLHDLVDVYANTNGTVNIISQTSGRVVFTQVVVNNSAVQQRSQFQFNLPAHDVHVAAFGRSGANILLLLRTNVDVGEYYLYPVSKNLSTAFPIAPLTSRLQQPRLFASTKVVVILDGIQAELFTVRP